MRPYLVLAVALCLVGTGCASPTLRLPLPTHVKPRDAFVPDQEKAIVFFNTEGADSLTFRKIGTTKELTVMNVEPDWFLKKGEYRKFYCVRIRPGDYQLDQARARGKMALGRRLYRDDEPTPLYMRIEPKQIIYLGTLKLSLRNEDVPVRMDYAIADEYAAALDELHQRYPNAQDQPINKKLFTTRLTN